jgi:hypothetical protein
MWMRHRYALYAEKKMVKMIPLLNVTRHVQHPLCLLLVLIVSKCDYPYHLGCLDPPLTAVPEGEWFCPNCREVPGEPAAKAGEKKAKAKTKAEPGAKRKAVVPQGTSGGFASIAVL